MNLLFRDHTLSDLIGFVYSGMPPQEAARQPHVQDQGIGEAGAGERAGCGRLNHSGWRECVGILSAVGTRVLCEDSTKGLQRDSEIEAVTVTEAIARHKNNGKLNSLVPGSWINANFNVWIGAPEDNRAWDYLYHARNFYAAGGCAVQPRRSASWRWKRF